MSAARRGLGCLSYLGDWVSVARGLVGLFFAPFGPLYILRVGFGALEESKSPSSIDLVLVLIAVSESGREIPGEGPGSFDQICDSARSAIIPTL